MNRNHFPRKPLGQTVKVYLEESTGTLKAGFELFIVRAVQGLSNRYSIQMRTSHETGFPGVCSKQTLLAGLNQNKKGHSSSSGKITHTGFCFISLE